MNNNIASQVAFIIAVTGFFVFGFSIDNPNREIQATPVPVKVEQPEAAKEEPAVKEVVNRLTQEETVLLFHALLKECSICDNDEQKDIIKVFLSRRDDPRFPNTIKGVLNQRGAVHGVKKYDQDVWLRSFNNVIEAVQEERDPEIVGYYYPKKSTNKGWVNKVKNKVEVKHDYHHFHTI